MKTRQHLMLVAAFASLAGQQTVAQDTTASKHPLIDSLEHALNIKMTVDGFTAYHDAFENPERSLVLNFEDTDRDYSLSPKDQVIYVEATNDKSLKSAWMQKFDEDTYKDLYKHNKVLEDQRYQYVDGFEVHKAVAEALKEADPSISYIADSTGETETVFIIENVVRDKSPQPLIKMAVEKYKSGL